MDVSFGGLMTNLKDKLIKGIPKEDLCYSVQETIFAMMTEIAERALAHTGKKELLLGGGVACNKRLQEMCRKMCEARNCKFFAIENQFLVDNGAMIAFQGMIEHIAGKKNTDTKIRPYERTDDIEVNWK
jgi:N6-L-threonylcarbamoyladenine synthase/protein kinase Bud32